MSQVQSSPLQVAILKVKAGAYQKATGVLELEAAGSVNQKLTPEGRRTFDTSRGRGRCSEAQEASAHGSAS